MVTAFNALWVMGVSKFSKLRGSEADSNREHGRVRMCYSSRHNMET